MAEKVKGPIEILCDEIGYPHDKALDRVDVFVAFVDSLVGEISDMIAWRSVISRGYSEPGYETAEAMRPLKAVRELLTITAVPERDAKCAELHNGILSQPDEGPCNHFLDMLSSCVSAIRFGLEIPCHSRHAAEAASHVWKHKYGLRLFDQHTSRWEKDWACQKMQSAIIGLLP